MYNCVVEKSGRLNIRVTEEQHSLLRRAADAAGQTLSDYVLSRVLAEAEAERVDQRVFALDAAGWREMEGRIARPGRRIPELRRLLRDPAPWEAAGQADVHGEAPVVDLMQALEASLNAAKWAAGWRIIVAPKSTNVVVISDDDDVATA